MSKSIKTTEQNIETTTAFNDAIFGDHDVSRIDEHVTADIAVYDGDDVFHGVEETREYFQGMLEMFPDISLETYEMLADGDLVSFRCEMSGTNEGDIVFVGDEPVPATGESASWGAMVLARFVDGKMSEARVVSEDLALVEQLGLLDGVAA